MHTFCDFVVSACWKLSTLKVNIDCDFFQDIASITGSHKTEQRNADLTGDETSRLFVKKTIVVGNVSK